MEIACGMLGYTPQIFWDITPRELQNAIEGYRKKQNEEWERVRWSSFYSVVPWVKGFKPEKVWLPIDAEKDAEFTTHGEVKRIGRDDLKEVWKRSGFEISESELDRIYGTKDGI